MLNIRPVVEQVKRNCDISDAKYALEKFHALEKLEDFKKTPSETTVDDLFATQMWNLYINETGIEPWKELSFTTDPNFGIWWEKKLSLWEGVKDKELLKISIDGKEYEYLDMEGINKRLNPEGYFYLSAIGDYRNKICFLLAELTDTRKENGYDVYALGKELARDLISSSTGLAFHSKVGFGVRKEVIKYHLWAIARELESYEVSPEKRILEEAFQYFGLSESELFDNQEVIDKKIENILIKRVEPLVHHEEGHEVIRKVNRVLPLIAFCKLLNSSPETYWKLFVTGVDEVLADTCKHNNLKGQLSYIIDQKDAGSLAFYVYGTIADSKYSGTCGKDYIEIFSELVPAYEKFRETGDWDIIENARRSGYRRTKGLAIQLRKNLKTG